MNNKNNKSFIKALIKEMLLKELYSEDSVKKAETAIRQAVGLKSAAAVDAGPPAKRIKTLNDSINLAIESMSMAIDLNTTIAKLKTLKDVDQQQLSALEQQSDKLVQQLLGPGLMIRDYITRLVSVLPKALPEQTINEFIAGMKNKTPQIISPASKSNYSATLKSIKSNPNIWQTSSNQILQKATEGFIDPNVQTVSTIKDAQNSVRKATQLGLGNIAKVQNNLDATSISLSNNPDIFLYLDLCDVQPFDNNIKQQARATKSRIYQETGLNRGELESLEQQFIKAHGGTADFMRIWKQQMGGQPTMAAKMPAQMYPPEATNKTVPQRPAAMAESIKKDKKDN
jgi:hypothetical protein